MVVACSSERGPHPDPHPRGGRGPVRAAIVEESVTLDAGGRRVAARIARPASQGRHPAIVFIAGSGPTDGDWCSPLLAAKNCSGKLLAQALARAGFVTLRYDKLGTGAGVREADLPRTIAWSDYVAEQRAALAHLAGRADVRTDRVVVAGHSEGGLHALHLAAQPGVTLAGVVLLATPGRPFGEVVLGQLEGQFRRAGVSGRALDEHLRPIRAAIDDVGAGRRVDVEAVSSVPAIRQLVAAIASPKALPFARELIAFDPLAAFARLEQPVLIVQGGRDVQVSPTLDAEPLADAARRAGRRVTLRQIEHADHILKHEETPLSALGPMTVAQRYEAPDRVLDADVVDAIVQWVRAL